MKILRSITFVFVALFILISGSRSLAEESATWEIDGMEYTLVRREHYDEYYNRTSVEIVEREDAPNYLLVSAGHLEGELVAFDMGVYEYLGEDGYGESYVHYSVDSLTATITFADIREWPIEPGRYVFSVAAKGFDDASIDVYDLYVSEAGQNGGNTEDKEDTPNGEITEDKENTPDGGTTEDKENTPDDGTAEDKENTPDSGTTEDKENITNDGATGDKEQAPKEEVTEENKNVPNNEVIKDKDETGNEVEENVSVPKEVTIQTVKRTASKKAKITWKKLNEGEIFYEVQYSLSKKFKKKDTVTKTLKRTTITISKLNKNKKYYVRVRAYKVVNGKKVYGSYSKVKTIIIKDITTI